MPRSLLAGRFPNAVDGRFLRHLKPAANMFRLNIVTPEGSTRHNLMVPTTSPRHVRLDGHPVMSHLWLFYQGAEHSHTPKMAFLGAMYLPSAAKRALIDSNTIAPAFTEQGKREGRLLL